MSCFDLKDINSELNKVKNAIFNLPLNYGSLDLSSKFMTDRQIAKKILKAKFPKKGRSETEIDDDLNQIVYGTNIRKRKGSSYKPYISEIEFEDEADRLSENLERGEDGFVPISRDNPIFDDISLLKSQIRISAFQLGEKGQSLGKDLTSLGTLLGSSLPAMAALMVSIPIPNIPGALSILLIVLKAVEDFFNKIKDLMPYLDILSKLELVIGPISFDFIQGILCNYLRIFSDVLSAINSLTAPLQSVLKGKTPKERTDEIQKAKDSVDESQNDLNDLGWFKTLEETGVSQINPDQVEKSNFGDGWILKSKKISYIQSRIGNKYTPQDAENVWKSSLSSSWNQYTKCLESAKKLAQA
jgi:hypothetical protein